MPFSFSHMNCLTTIGGHKELVSNRDGLKRAWLCGCRMAAGQKTSVFKPQNKPFELVQPSTQRLIQAFGTT